MQLKNKAKEISAQLSREYKLPLFAMPKISKINVSVGIGKERGDEGKIKLIENELAKITGQHPKYDIAKKSIAGFKLREGQKIGFSVTLRDKNMWGFFAKVVGVVLPRMRDFKGIDPKSFDKSNNLTIGIKEQIVFPEIRSDEVKEIWGMSITVNIKCASNRELTQKYLSLLGLIFKKE